jgi:hypothetical protein
MGERQEVGKAMQAIFVSNSTVIANCQRYNIDSRKHENGEEDDTLSISIDEDEDNQVEL